MKYIIGRTGVLLAIIGWVLSNASRLSFVYKIFAPKFLRANSALTKMYKSNLLREGDKGFTEISELIFEKYIDIKEKNKAKEIDIKITQIELLSSGAIINTETEKIGDKPELMVNLSNSQTITGKASFLNLEIKNRYLSSKIFHWGYFHFLDWNNN